MNMNTTDDTQNAGGTTEGFVPPYTSFRTLVSTLERMEQETPPSRIDRSYLSNMPGGSQTQFIAGMRALGLIDSDNRPTTILKNMVREPADRQTLLGHLIEDRYGWALALGANATQGELEEAFRRQGVNGTTLRKSVAFFLAAAKYAEIRVSPHFKTPKIGVSGPKPATSAKPKAAAASPKGRAAARRGAKGVLEMDDLKRNYIDMLLEKVKEGDTDPSLLGRVEWLLGFRADPPGAEQGAPSGTTGGESSG
jgi:hypothetical protein